MRRQVLAALLLGTLTCETIGGADETPEYAVKAAFLLNFARFAEWPEASFRSAAAPLEICVLGENPFGRALDDIVRGEAVQDRRIVIRQVTQAPEPGTCQMLFVRRDVAGVRTHVPSGVLVVSDDPRFLRDGAMVAFVVEDRRVRFDINPKAADRAGLKISSKLLSVARRVIQ